MADTSVSATFTRREVTVEGHRAVMKVDDALRDLEGKAWCPWHLTVHVLLADELSSTEPEEALGQLEETIHGVVRSVAECDYIGRVSVNGLGELHFYVDAPEAVLVALAATREQRSGREFDYLLSYDEAWSEVTHLFDYG